MSYPVKYRRAAITKTDSARVRALRIALELFAKQGLNGTSVAEIAEQTGLTKAGLLHHYGSKNALLLAVLDERDTENSLFLSAPDEELLGWAAFDALLALVAKNQTDRVSVDLFIKISAEATNPSHPAHQWALDHYARLRTWLTESIAFGIEAGTMNARMPIEPTITNTISILDGLQIQWVISDYSINMVEAFEHYLFGLRKQWAVEAPR